MWLTGVQWLSRSMKQATHIVPSCFIFTLIWNLRQRVCLIDSAELTLLFVAEFVLCLLTGRERHGGHAGVWKHSGTCRCGARTDTGMRCNLWRVLFDYGTVTDYRTETVIPLLSMIVCNVCACAWVSACWDHLAWNPSSDKLTVLTHICGKYNINCHSQKRF